ncbi:MAG TPA: ArsA-related P-loop ATPase [Vicinamibacteria bacterium]|nr:ArsA-related P-loop ATPase [Vicinamibacteria bacterium]
MLAERLLERRLVVLSGKGGVGKSVVGAALALLAAERGKRTLLVEIDAPLEAARYLGAPPSGPQPTEVRPRLYTVNLHPRGVMDEYVRHTVRVELFARRILDSPIYARFFTTAPALKELMLLGKVMMFEDERQGWSRRHRWDLVVLDAPATGHGLSFLKVPLAASAAVPIGPVGANARRILALLRDRKRTALIVVAIPEEMAVVEAAWFHELAVEQLGLDCAAVVLNAAHERRFTEAEEAAVLRLTKSDSGGRIARDVELQSALVAARRHIRRRKLTRFYETRLKRSLQAPFVSLPFLFADRFGLAEIRALSGRLAEA